ncbi:hypothetical protein HZU75_07040 [Chitinibacter fontanus]|uniref:Uncharacterized protein n=1 Tax=Chitinibacter fontanus TaxID=1737446 RepID=A0A7D5V9D9_9NEIS|nr:hypothetical protein [Chitinibacter fontanus]QLI81298.1 hypothetical protein HZU75_07040 [Chitinibacter fontanus]
MLTIRIAIYIIFVFIISETSYANEIKKIDLKNGINFIEQKGAAIAITKSKGKFVSGSESDFFTGYFLPSGKTGEWIIIQNINKTGPASYYSNEINNMDCNTQSIAFFKRNNELLFARAERSDLERDCSIGKANIKIHFYKFTVTAEIPKFIETETKTTKNKYLDAFDALEHESWE